MQDLTPATITNAFSAYARYATSVRTRELLVGLAEHLHRFIRDAKLTPAEWANAIEALTRAGMLTDGARNEFVLLSDLLGVSSLVDMVNAAPDGTPSSVLGPFFMEDAPTLANGGDLWRGQVGEPLVVSGRVVDARGEPAAGAVLSLWQCAGNGLYAQQDPQQGIGNYHARLAVAADGGFAFSTVRPVAYEVPDDGPGGDLLHALGRHAWRPAHLHVIVDAPGHRRLVTEFFLEGDEYLDEDAVFGVRKGLVVPMGLVEDRASLPAHLIARAALPMPVSTMWLTIRLAATEATAPLH